MPAPRVAHLQDERTDVTEAPDLLRGAGTPIEGACLNRFYRFLTSDGTSAKLQALQLPVPERQQASGKVKVYIEVIDTCSEF